MFVRPGRVLFFFCFFFWTTETLRLSAKQACFLPPKLNKRVEFTLTTECMTSIFRKYSESLTDALWVAPSFIFWWSDSDNGLMNLWHVSKTHPKNTPTALFSAESCHHWNHFLRWCWSLRLQNDVIWMSISRLPAVSLLFIIGSFLCWVCWFAQTRKHDWKLWPLWKQSDLESQSDDL